MLRIERFLRGVERTRADVAVDDAQREKGQRRRRPPAVRLFGISGKRSLRIDGRGHLGASLDRAELGFAAHREFLRKLYIACAYSLTMNMLARHALRWSAHSPDGRCIVRLCYWFAVDRVE